MKKILNRKICIVLVSLLVIFSACTRPEKVEQAPLYSGEVLFKGIVFGSGEIADTIPELKKVKDFISAQSWNEKQKAAYGTIQDSIMAKIRRVDPDYFNAFQANVQSGDPVLITSSLKMASLAVRAAMFEDNASLALLLSHRYFKGQQAKLDSSESVRELSRLLASQASDTARFNKLVLALVKEKGLGHGLLVNVDVNNFIESVKSINLQSHLILPNQPVLDINRTINREPSLDINNSINRPVIIDASRSRQFDVERSFSRNLDFQISKDFIRSQAVSILRSLDINRDLHRQFDRILINRAQDRDMNVGEELWVATDVAVAVEVVVVVVIAVAAVAVIEKSVIFNDKGNIFNEQLVSSLSKRLDRGGMLRGAVGPGGMRGAPASR
jgi:SdpC family antimicrobial peptide